MYDPCAIEMAEELGMDPEDFSDPYAEDSGVAFNSHQYSAANIRPEYGFRDDIETSSPSPPERRMMQRKTQQFFQSQPTNRHNHNQYEHPQFEPSNTQQSKYHANANIYDYDQADSLHSLTTAYNSQSMPGPYDQSQSFRSDPIDEFEYEEQELRSQQPVYNNQQRHTRGSNPRNAHGTRLRPVSELPDIYRGMFKFGVFNAVQSTCFDTVLHSDENMVLGAPTGSGKTVLFELAIIRMLNQGSKTGHAMKCVYVAPTKALCAERHRDWTTKFDALGIKCCELTGDTALFGKGAWGDAKTATIIITTGEKWDSLTRNWDDHAQTLSQIQLFLVDEVHILNESRGSTLEVVISRMKLRGSGVRFVLVSATVPNIDDVAAWIENSSNGSAQIFEFGEEYRPCKLTRFVYAITRTKTMNDWIFSSILDQKLFGILQQHSVNQPMLIFCPTRKGCVQTAQLLAKDYDKAMTCKGILPWSQPKRIDREFHDKVLAELALAGIGVHHAGLTLEDRRCTEELFLSKVLRVIVSTSTLAVGVNLPAHTVVIKGVKMFQNGTTKEYSDLDVMQMMGRAGRPQFDKEGTAIILCESELEQKYKALVNGTTKLESSLHLNLDEHLNSEIGLGTITNVESAKDWLRHSFLWRRLQKNPKHYAIGKEDGQTWQVKVDELVMRSVKKLKETELVEYELEGDGDLCSTEYGDIMSKYYIKQSTMSLILKLSQSPSVRNILEMLSASEELADLRIRGGEKSIYDKLRQHSDIRFTIKKVQNTSDKIFVLTQAVLGGLSLNNPEYKKGDSQPQLEVFTIFRHITRIARAVIEVAIVKKSGAQLKHGLEVLRCLSAKAWEDRPVVLRQIDQIGEKSLKVLAEAGINSLKKLVQQDPFRLETLLNRRSPFGFEVLAAAKDLPEYSLRVTEANLTSSGGNQPVQVELSVECSTNQPSTSASTSKAKKQKGRGINMTTVLTVTSDLEFIDFRRIPTKALKNAKTFSVIAHLTKPSQSISVVISSETIAGVSVTHIYKPQINPNRFPTMNTRPRTNLENDLQGLEENADFWNMSVDEDPIPIKDLTQQPKDIVHRTETKDKQKPQNKSSLTVVEHLDSKPVPPKQLPNGNYECNHSCKDKTKCRHFCCRDGLAEPPAAPKKRTVSIQDQTTASATVISERSPTSFSHVVEPRSKKRQQKVGPKVDKTMQHLEALHQGADVQKSIGIRDGHRLKLADSSNSLSTPSTRKPKIVPNFDLTFADQSDEPIPGDPYSEDDDDDLPSIGELLESALVESAKKSSKMPSPPSDYSNSEMDALIRDVPSDVLQATPTTMSVDPYNRSNKRAREIQNENSGPHHILQRTPSPQRKRKRTEIPLFLAASSDDHFADANKPSPLKRTRFPAEQPQENDDFVLDYTLFDIVPATSDLTKDENTPESGSPNSRLSDQRIVLSSDRWNPTGPEHDHQAANSAYSFTKPHNTSEASKPTGAQSAPDTAQAYDDPMADLEEWLTSGAVTITD